MGSTHSLHDGPDPNVNIEMRDADLGIVGKSMAGIMLGLFACMGIGVLHFKFEQSMNAPSKQEPSVFTTTGRIPPAPRLQAFPAADLATFNAQQAAKLEGYGWVDKQGEVAHVPIAEGMERLLKQGLPSRAEGQPFQLADPKPAAGAAKPAAAAAKP